MEDVRRPGDSLFLNESLSDVTIRVVNEGVSWRFPAHKLILQHGSTLLDDMEANSTPFPDSDEADCSNVVIFQDISPDTMILILRYLYTGEMPPMNTEPAFRLLVDSKRFKIDDLSALCENRLLSSISLRDVCWLMESCSNIGLDAISQVCEDVIKSHAQVIFASRYILQLSRATMQRLLAAEDLNVVDESIAFSGLWRWAKQECCRSGKEMDEQHVADACRDLLHLIRFSVMRDRSIVPHLVLERSRKTPCGEEFKTLRPRMPYRQPPDLLDHCLSVVLQGPRCWEGLRLAVASRELCVTISVDREVYLTALQADVVEQRPQGNVLYICVTKEESEIDVHRQEVVWADTYDIKTANGSEESWLLCDTRFPVPIRLAAHTLYSVYLITVGKPGESFPWQAIGQTQKHFRIDGQGLNITLHSAFLVALKKLFFISLDMPCY